MGLERAALEAAEAAAAIPSAPAVVLRCFDVLHDADACIDDLTGVLRTDPGLVSDVMRLANSPVYGFHRQVDTLEDAVVRLGFRRIGDVVVTRKLMEVVDDCAYEPLDAEDFWRRSLTTAMFASRLVEGLRNGLGDRAFLAGLLADIGVVLLNRASHDDYCGVARTWGKIRLDRWLTMEDLAVSVDHAQVGALVLEHWQLPVEVCEAVRWHHTELADVPLGVPGRVIAGMLCTANRLTDVLWHVAQPSEAADECAAVLTGAGLQAEFLVRHLREIERDALELATTLRIPMEPFEAFHDVAEALRDNLARSRRRAAAMGVT